MPAVAAGIALVHNGRLLLMRRRLDCDAGGCWAYPGGKIEPGETAQQAAIRELREETGLRFTGPLRSLGVAPNGFHGFLALVDNAPGPRLNEEHTAFEWAAFDALPAPLHPHMIQQLCVAAEPDRYIAAALKRLRP